VDDKTKPNSKTATPIDPTNPQALPMGRKKIFE
jgi:hypothetical protein